MSKPLSDRLRTALPRGLFIDLEDRLRAEAFRAHEMVKDHAGLDPKRARELVGQARFRMMEKGFEEVCALHGGRILEGGVIPSTDLKVFQPFMRFEVDGGGVLLGLASMTEPQTVPHKNMSRLAAVKLNYHLSPRLDLDGSGAKIGDIFTLFLTARDRAAAGKIQEIALGTVDSKYETFLFYEPLERFLAGYVPTPPAPQIVQPVTETPAAVSLKSKIVPFVPPERPQGSDDEEADSK
jgi:hypothetical protein